MKGNESKENIDGILAGWPFRTDTVVARWAKGDDGRKVIQMRLEMGLLQMETEGRPDGERPGGMPTTLDLLRKEAARTGRDWTADAQQCQEIDREFAQYYHRRVCWLALRDFRRAVLDADHTLALMDFSSAHAEDEEWVLSHEQYRPFVMFHRIQAAALAGLEESGPEEALEAIDAGLIQFRELYEKYDAEDELQDDELVGRLEELKESIRAHYNLGPTLIEQLADAVASEQYERAAKLRDEIAQRDGRKRRTKS